MRRHWKIWTVALLIVVGVGGLVAQQPVSQGPQAATAAAWLNNISQWAGSTLGAPSNYGTSPGAVTVPGVNAFVTNTVGVSFSPSSSSSAATSTFDFANNAATQVKATGGNVYGYEIFNPNTSVCYLQFYNNAAATLGTGALHPIAVQAGVSVGFISPTPLFNLATAISTGGTTTATGGSTCTTAMVGQIVYF